MSLLEAFPGWKPDMSKWQKFGIVGTAEKMGYARKFDEPHKIAVWIGATKKSGIGVIWQTDMKKEVLLKQPFPVAGGNKTASLESLRDLVRPEVKDLGELLEVPYDHYLKIKQHLNLV